jgi:hypothetical protein
MRLKEAPPRGESKRSDKTGVLPVVLMYSQCSYELNLVNTRTLYIMYTYIFITYYTIYIYWSYVHLEGAYLNSLYVVVECANLFALYVYELVNPKGCRYVSPKRGEL